MAVGFVLITTEPGMEVSVREKVAEIDCDAPEILGYPFLRQVAM